MSVPSNVLIEIAEATAALPVTRQTEVLDFVLFLKQREIEASWDAISDQEATEYRTEFATEDRVMAERATEDYLTQLKREDEA
jgi:hypothetical protein